MAEDPRVPRWRHELAQLTRIADPAPWQKRRIAELYENLEDDESAYMWWGYAAAAGDRGAIDMVELLTEERRGNVSRGTLVPDEQFDALIEASTLKAVRESGRLFHPLEEDPVEYCQNCQSTYKDTPEERRHHAAPCYRCGSDGHSPCQH